MSMNYNDLDLPYIEVAVLMETVNKYKDNMCKFYLQSLTPNKPKTLEESVVQNNTANLANVNNISTSNVTTGSTITLLLPKEIARNYPKKWIPQGTRFLVSFIGGDLTKPVIIGREFDGQGLQQS